MWRNINCHFTGHYNTNSFIIAITKINVIRSLLRYLFDHLKFGVYDHILNRQNRVQQ